MWCRFVFLLAPCVYIYIFSVCIYIYITDIMWYEKSCLYLFGVCLCRAVSLVEEELLILSLHSYKVVIITHK